MAIIDENGVHRRLEIMLGSKALADEYIKRYGYTVHIAKVKGLIVANEYRQKVHAIDQPKEQSVDPTDPIFQVKVKCPACYCASISLWELKARSLTVTPDRFQMPSYSPAGKFRFVDYNLVSVTVCPQCLYASPDKKDFVCLDVRRNEIPAALHQGEVAAILADADCRSTLLKTSGLDLILEHFYDRERTPKAAIFAYQMALERAKIEALRNVPFALFKMGGYALKQALIARKYGFDDTPYLQVALRFYKQSFEHSSAKGPQYESFTLYEIVALDMRLGDEGDAGNFLAVLDRLKSEQTTFDSGFNRWYNATRDLWADRENPDLWKT